MHHASILKGRGKLVGASLYRPWVTNWQMFKFSSKPWDDGDLLGAQGTSLGLFLVSPKAPSHVTYHILRLQNLNRIDTASKIIFFGGTRKMTVSHTRFPSKGRHGTRRGWVP